MKDGSKVVEAIPLIRVLREQSELNRAPDMGVLFHYDAVKMRKAYSNPVCRIPENATPILGRFALTAVRQFAARERFPL
jgi:hypothetical protein